MKNLWANIKVKMQQFMSGRYGVDELSSALWIVSVIMLVIGMFPDFQILSTLGMILWVWMLIRCFSRNISRRQQERDAYMKQVNKVRDWFYWKRQAWKLRDTYRFYRCKQCGKMMRVPKGKGKIKITCPQCKQQIIKKT